MRQAFWAVLLELWDFVCGTSKQQAPSSTIHETNTGTSPHTDLVATTDQQRTQAHTTFDFARTTSPVAYIADEPAGLFFEPHRAFDQCVQKLHYGTKVRLGQKQAEYIEVWVGELRGWVHCSVLADESTHVFPQLVSDTVYNATDQETRKLRRCLEDQHLAGVLALPLQTEEYIFYRLWRHQIPVDWPFHRPRRAGNWQSLLRGERGVQMSIEPRTASILEYRGEETAPFLGYVTAVHPDQSIELCSVGRLQAGEFREETFTREKWREWRPVFLTFR